LSWFFWTAFVHVKESSVLGISNIITGQPAILGNPWQVIDPIVIALPISVAALVAGWAYENYWSKSEDKSNGRTGAND
jgi:SSS family solute:Na+ symporter